MQFQFTAHNFTLSDPVKQHVIEKFEPLERHFNIPQVHVVMQVDKLRQIVEATLHIPGHEVAAHDESENMYTTISKVADKLNRQLIKHKEKMRSK